MGKRKPKRFENRAEVLAEIDRLLFQCQERIKICEKAEVTKKQSGIWLAANSDKSNTEKYREQFWLIKNLQSQIDSAMGDYYRRQGRLDRLKKILAEIDTVAMPFIDQSVQL